MQSNATWFVIRLTWPFEPRPWTFRTKSSKVPLAYRMDNLISHLSLQQKQSQIGSICFPAFNSSGDLAHFGSQANTCQNVTTHLRCYPASLDLRCFSSILINGLIDVDWKAKKCNRIALQMYKIWTVIQWAALHMLIQDSGLLPLPGSTECIFFAAKDSNCSREPPK